MKQLFKLNFKSNIYIVAAYNLLIVMCLLMFSRIAYFLVNLDAFPNVTFTDFLTIMQGGVMFDISAMLYLNIVYILMIIIPFHFRYNKTYLNTAKWIFYITNSFGLIANCIDMIYFKYTNRRTTATVFGEFSNEGNIGKIFLESFVQYWYVSVIAIVLIFILIKLYRFPQAFESPYKQERPHIYYIRNVISMILVIMFTIFGIRGGIGSFVRPITLSNANKYVTRPLEASIVLNTPFCIIRTCGKKVFRDPKYFDREKMQSLYEPIIKPHPKGEFKKLNVVVFIVESFSKEFVGSLNKDLDNGKYKGYTPFLDSLINQGLTFEYTYSNGRKSIDAMPSVLSSIPMFYEPYFLTSFSNNKVSGIAGELSKKGYYTAFFHGAPNGSMGFQAFARVTGFKDYYGKDEYNNNDDYDGTWAIWDEPFLQFYAKKMSTFKQPFMTAVFTATSHHPFHIPESYKDIYKESGIHPIHKCVRYTDNAIRQFFATASKQAWFKNTLFVITADHTNALTRKEYLTDAGRYKVPIIFYHPGSNLKGRIQTIAQQIDIMPTVLGYLNYDKPYVAFGHDLLDDSYKEHYAINFNNQIFQLFKNDKMYQFDGQKTSAIYNLKDDLYLQKNIITTANLEEKAKTENQIKAIIQQYVLRILENNMTIKQ